MYSFKLINHSKSDDFFESCDFALSLDEEEDEEDEADLLFLFFCLFSLSYE